MEGLSLGSAFFNLALNTAGLAQGLAGTGSAVSGAVGKVVPGIGKIGESFGKADEKIGGIIRSTERFSRGLRNVSPEIQRATEQVYAMEDSQKRLGRSIERQKMLIQEKEQAEKKNLDTIKQLREEEDKHALNLRDTSMAMQKELEKLDQMKASRVQDAAAIEKQEAAYNKLNAEYEQSVARQNRMRAELALLEKQQQRNADKADLARIAVQKSQATLNENMAQQNALRETINRLTVDYQTFATKLTQTEAVQEREAAQAVRYREAVVAQKNALSDLLASKMQMKTLDAEAQRDVDLAVTKQAQLKIQLEKTKEAYGTLSTMFAAGMIPQREFDEATLGLTRLSQEYDQAGDRVRELARAHGELVTEHSRVAQSEAFLRAQIEETEKRQVEMEANASRRGAILEKQRAQYEAMPAEIEKQQAALQRLEATEEQLANRIRQNIAIQEELPLKQERDAAAVEEKRKAIASLDAEMEKLNIRMADESARLGQLKSQYGPTSEEIKKQESILADLAKQIDQEGMARDRSNQKIAEAEQRQMRLNKETENSKLTLADLVQSENKYATAVGLAKQRLEEKLEKVNQKKQAEAENKQITEQVARSEEQVAEAAKKAAAETEQFGNASTRLGDNLNGVGEKANNLKQILMDIAVGSVSSFIGNTLSSLVTGVQGFAATGLDAYKNYQLLTMSLTALSAREGVMTGQFKDLGAAQEWAKGRSKELVDWMSKLAIQSPFSVEDISGAFRLGNALGFTASETQNLIAKTVDWAAATGASREQITSVTRALGQMHNTGHASLEDINQLTDAGLGARDILRNEFAPEIKKTGMTLEDMVSAGLIPADRAINAISRSIGTDFAGGASKAGDSMEGLLNSIGDLKNTALREFFTRTFEVVSPLITRIVSVLQDDSTIQSIITFGNMIGDGIGKALLWVSDVAFPAIMSAVKTFGPAIMDGFAYLVAIGQEAYDWGYNVGAQFAQGLADTVEAIMDVINYVADTITYWLEPHSPPKALPKIDGWGKQTMQVYLDGFGQASPEKSVRHIRKKVQEGLKSNESPLKAMGQDAIKTYFNGWTQADFGTFDTIKNNISGVLQGLVDGGSMKEKDLIPTLLGAGDGVKRAIDDIRKTGSISQDTFGRIRTSVGKANTQVSDYIESMLRVEQANRAVERAQNELNAVTAKYDKQLDPLRKKLEALNGSTSNADRDAELKRLESMKQAYASNGMQRNAAKIQAEIDRINTEKQIEQLEKKQAIEEAAAAKKVVEKQKIADKEAMQLDMQRTLIDQQKEQNELIKRQIELLTKKDEAGGAGGSTADAQAKAALAEQKKAQQEEQSRQKAEYSARLAAANSEEDKLRIMQEEQSKYKAGTKEYLDMQAKIDVQKKKVAKASEDAARAEVDHNLAMAEGDQKMQILQDRMAQLDPQSEEYAKRKEQLLKLTQEQDKAQQKLSDAEFESDLAGKSKAEQLVMLKDRLGTLTEGTMEYEKTLKRVNALQFGLDNKKEPKGRGGGKGRKKKDKSEIEGGGGILDTFSKVDNVAKNVTKTIDGIGGAFSGVQDRITTFQGKVKPFFDFLNQSGGAIAFVFQKLLVSFVVGLAIEKVIKPLFGFIWGLRQFITWGNVAWVALAALGYAWKINFGGIRDIAYELWQSLQEPFRDIVAMVNRVKDAFDKGGFSAAISEFFSSLPELGGDIANIGILVFNAIRKWTGPFIDTLVDILKGAIDWVAAGGPLDLLNQLGNAISHLIEIVFSPGFLSSAAISGGILGLIGGFSMIFQSALGGILLSMNEEGPKIFAEIANWLQENIPVAFRGLMDGLSVAFVAIGEALVPTIVWVVKRLIDVASWLLPMIPDLLAGLADFISVALAWLIGRGLPLITLGLLDLLNYLLLKLGEVLPEFALKLGQFIFSTITKLSLALIAGIAGLFAQSGVFQQKLQEGAEIFKQFCAGFVKGIIAFVVGALLGLVQPFKEFGVMILRGLGEGIDSGWAMLIQSFIDGWNTVFENIKNLLGIHSPSTVFMELGKFLIDGLRQGMEFIHQLFDDVLAWLGSFVTSGIAWFANMFTTVLVAIDAFITMFLSALVKWQDDVLKTIEFLVLHGIDFFANLILVVTDKIIAFFADILSRFGISRDSILAVVDDLKTKAVAGFTWLKETASKVIQEFQNFITDTWNGIRDTATELWSEGADGIVGRIMGGVTKLSDKFKKFFMGQEEGSIQWYVKQAWDTIKDTLITSWDQIGRVIGDKIDDMRLIIRGSINEMIDMANKAIDSLNVVPGVNIPHIPNFYKGTQFAPGGMAIVGENGPEMIQLPRGSEVMTNSRTMSIFEDMARNVMRSMSEGVNNAMKSIEKAVDGATSAISNASQQQPNIGAQGPQTVITQNNNVKNERHDHWNLTVNTRATEGTVKTDFATMMSLAGV